MNPAATLRPSDLAGSVAEARPRVRWSPALTIAVAATLLALVVTFPLGLHPASVIYGTVGDSTGTISTFWWWAYALEHGRALLDNTMWGAPYGAGWSQVPFAVLPLVVFTPLSMLVGPTAAYNLGVLSSFPLTAVLAYFAARRLGMTALAAAFSGLAFAFIPYHQMKATGHMLQAHMELFPALLLFLLRWRAGGSRWNLVAAGAMLGLGVWIDYQFAFIMLFLFASFMVASLLVPRRRSTPSLALPLKGEGNVGEGNVGQGNVGQGNFVRQVVAAGIVAVTVVAFLPAAVLLGHRPGSGGYGQSLASTLGQYQRNLGDIDIYSVRPWEYLMPWSSNPLVPDAVRAYQAAHLHGSNSVEQAQTLGYTVIVLALGALIWFRPRFPVLLSALTGIVGAVIALPADIHAFGTILPGPAVALNHVVPFIRGYNRFGVLVMFGATLLAGLGFVLLESRARAHRVPWLLAVPFLLLALEFNSQPPAHTTTLFPAPNEYAWLKAQPSGILIEYPVVATAAREEVESRQYTLYQQVHLHPLFNGSAPKSQADLMAASLDPYYKPGVAAQLRTLGIRYVFVHRHDYLAAGYGLPRAVEGLTYVGPYDGGDVDAYLVTGTPGA